MMRGKRIVLIGLAVAGSLSVWWSVRTSPKSSRPVNTCSRELSIVDYDDVPIDSVRIALSVESAMEETLVEGMSDSRGLWCLPNEIGGTVPIGLTLPDSRSDLPSFIGIRRWAAGATKVRVERGWSLRVRVIDEAGVPASKAVVVRATCYDQAAASFTSDMRGEVTLARLAQGPLRVDATRADHDHRHDFDDLRYEVLPGTEAVVIIAR
jgi:hypothetical protein